MRAVREGVALLLSRWLLPSVVLLNMSPKLMLVRAKIEREIGVCIGIRTWYCNE